MTRPLVKKDPELPSFSTDKLYKTLIRSFLHYREGHQSIREEIVTLFAGIKPGTGNIKPLQNAKYTVDFLSRFFDLFSLRLSPFQDPKLLFMINAYITQTPVLPDTLKHLATTKYHALVSFYIFTLFQNPHRPDSSNSATRKVYPPIRGICHHSCTYLASAEFRGKISPRWQSIEPTLGHFFREPTNPPNPSKINP